VTNFDSNLMKYVIEFSQRIDTGLRGLRIGHDIGGGSPDYDSVDEDPPFDKIKVNQWHHLAAIHSTDPAIGQKIYLDGSELNLPGEEINFEPSYTVHLKFGQRGGINDPDYRLNGMLDEISFYDRALRDQEIVDIVSADSDGKCNVAAQALCEAELVECLAPSPCAAKGSPCEDNGDCCSNKCRGKSGSKTCK